MTKPRWTGRVIKHIQDEHTPIEYGSDEKKALLEHYYEPLSAIVTEEDEGGTVRDVLVKHFNVSSKLLAQARQTEYGLTINEERVYISAPVQAGEIVRLRLMREESEDIMPQQVDFIILYEDNYLLIVNKPAGIVVHPTHGHYTNTLANGVVHYWKSKDEKYRFRPVHRLDEETSGIVVIAKNGYIHQQISEQMQHGEVDKFYVALVYGAVQSDEGIIDAPIDRDPNEPHLRIVCDSGYPSKTGYKVIERYPITNISQQRTGSHQEQVCYVELKLYTGRTHQIRVHMNSIGHPLVGDKLYGAQSQRIQEVEELMPRHALHAYKISFIHPITKQRMEWEAPIPDEFKQLQQRLRKEFNNEK